MFTILVADDEKSMIEFLEIMLVREGYNVITASSAEKAMVTISEKSIDLVITDISMPKAGGMAVLDKSIEVDPEIPVIMITAYASASVAVEAMKKGAYDYITKPFQVDEIKLVVAKALERRRDRVELIRLKQEVAEQHQLTRELIGRSENMLALFKTIRKVATSRSTILINGESGVGKELVAKAIHYISDRTDKPFHSINCGAMPEQLLESELFGHQKGSFTGAHADKKGLLELADGGTFFLDEIGEAPLSVQVKMLRALQEREFKRVGGSKDIKVDVRIIAASNQNLETLINEGKFREDLFYRLNIINLTIPPLRDRKEDIPILVARFIDKYSKLNNRDVNSITSSAMSLLENYHWRGNVRELENTIERAVVLSSAQVIDEDSLPNEIRFAQAKTSDGEAELPDDGIDFDAIISTLERDLLAKALAKSNGVKKEAARLLKMSFRSFRYKLAKYDISGKENSDS